MTEERIPINGITIDHVTELTVRANAANFGEGEEVYPNGAFKRGVDLDRLLIDPDCEVFVLRRSTEEVFIVSTLPEQKGLELELMQMVTEPGGELRVVNPNSSQE